MPYRGLFILIEGDDDERFFETLIKSKYGHNYNFVRLWKYSQIKQEKIINFIRSIKAMKADYIFVSDINLTRCVTEKKEKIRQKYGELIDSDKIAIVIKEIEGWYLGGLSDAGCKKFSIQKYKSTDNITKEQFNINFDSSKFDLRVDFMIEILKSFSFVTAKKKNKSFKYFSDKYL